MFGSRNDDKITDNGGTGYSSRKQLEMYNKSVSEHTWPRHGRHILALNPCRSFLLSEQVERTKKQLLQAEFPSPEKKS